VHEQGHAEDGLQMNNIINDHNTFSLPFKIPGS